MEKKCGPADGKSGIRGAPVVGFAKPPPPNPETSLEAAADEIHANDSAT